MKNDGARPKTTVICLRVDDAPNGVLPGSVMRRCFSCRDRVWIAGDRGEFPAGHTLILSCFRCASKTFRGQQDVLMIPWTERGLEVLLSTGVSREQLDELVEDITDDLIYPH